VPVLPILAALVWGRPTALSLGVGLGLMATGEGLRLWGAAYLGKTARSSRPRAGKLVTGGPYGHTRHPLYLGNFLLTLGFTLASGAGFPWFPGLVAVGFLLLYRGHARREEAVLAAAFPAAWETYAGAVPGRGWRRRGARIPGAGEAAPPTLRRALAVEAWTLNAEFWLLVALGVRYLAGGPRGLWGP
jgi:protein-S-isoprenylcysteine O-methyltransferase Ste14